MQKAGPPGRTGGGVPNNVPNERALSIVLPIRVRCPTCRIQRSHRSLYCAGAAVRKHSCRSSASRVRDSSTDRLRPNNGSAMINRDARSLFVRRRTGDRRPSGGKGAGEMTEAEQLRELAARLTSLGSRVIWDGELRIRSIAMFGER